MVSINVNQTTKLNIPVSMCNFKICMNSLGKIMRKKASNPFGTASIGRANFLISVLVLPCLRPAKPKVPKKKYGKKNF